jgi:hypothetical protein
MYTHYYLHTLFDTFGPFGFFYVLLINKKYTTFVGGQSKSIPTKFGKNRLSGFREED